MNILEKIKNKNAALKVNILKDHLASSGKVLDFGCGDLMFAHKLSKDFPELNITGVDVANFGSVPEGVKYVHYDGVKLPFKDNTFDIVIAFHVFHHCTDPIKAFEECLRVTKKKLLFVEPTYRSKKEIPVMKFMDWFYNTGKKESISLPYQFFSQEDWHKVFKKHKVKTQEDIDIDKFPKIIPFGRSYLFTVVK
mgnify:CR=1 FL=1